MTLDNLSNSDPLKWDKYYKMDVIQFLNLLAFYKHKQEVERHNQEAQRMKAGV